MATNIWNYFTSDLLYTYCRGIGAYSKVLNYAGVFAISLMILLIVHLVTTYYEKFDEKVSPPASSECQLSDKPKRLTSVVWRKRDRMARLKEEIEDKFKKSLMNQSYAFPRNQD